MSTDNLTPTVAENVKAAMTAAGESLLSMERGTGLTRDKLRRRLTGTSPWTTPEIALVSLHLKVSVSDLVTQQGALTEQVA